MRDTLVLCYHAFSPTWGANLSVTPAAFADQMETLRKAGYRGVTFTEAVQRRARDKEVAVTFDDAFESVVRLAKPVLDDLGWPATVYAVTDFAAQGHPVAWDGVDHWAQTPDAQELRSLDWNALRALHADGWEIGSHTVTHPRLTATDDERLAFELSASKAAVEAALGKPCPSIAYPYGDVDARVVQAAAAAGYATGAALPARWNELGALEWPRVGVWHGDDTRRFKIKASRTVRRIRTALRR